MADKRLPKERTFTPDDVARAHAEGMVYDPVLVDFVPVELPPEQAELLPVGGLAAALTKEAASALTGLGPDVARFPFRLSPLSWSMSGRGLYLEGPGGAM